MPIKKSSKKELTIGAKAPLKGAAKTALAKLSKGANVVLYFYPKDDTPGCTMEACDFRDQAAAFKKAGAIVVGVSPDSEKSHEKFRQKYDLNFSLLSDEGKDLCNAFGVWVEKNMYGRKYMGVLRSTFIIDSNGKIAGVWSKVKVKGHADEVLAALKELD